MRKKESPVRTDRGLLFAALQEYLRVGAAGVVALEHRLVIIRAKLFAYLAIAVITTVLVMVVSGRVTQFFLRRGKEV